jgi:hypothetical protein
MQSVIAIIKLGDTGAKVANLQDCLIALIDRQLIKSFDAPRRPTMDELLKLAVALKQERAASTFNEATKQLIRFFQVQKGLGDHLNGMVDDKTAAKLNDVLKSLGLIDLLPTFVVMGTILFIGDRPGGNVTVNAFDRDLRTRQLLGRANIDADGKYRISYSKDLFLRAEVDSADLFIEVRDIDDEVLGTSDTVFSAPPKLTVDLTIPGEPPRQPSEYEKLLALVLPLLKGQAGDGRDLNVAELTADDQAFIVRETGLLADRVSDLVLAAGAASSTLAINPHFKILSAAVFYGWFQDGLPRDLKELRRYGLLETLISSFERAQVNNVVPLLGIDIEELKSTLFTWVVSALLEPALPGEKKSLGDLLDSVSPDWLSFEQRMVVAIFSTWFDSGSDMFVNELQARGFAENDIAKIQAVLAAGN